MNPLVPILIRVGAAWAASLLARLFDATGLSYTPDEMSSTATEVVTFMVNWVLPVMASLAAVVKISLDKKFNKGNASVAPLIARENYEATRIEQKAG